MHSPGLVQHQMFKQEIEIKNKKKKKERSKLFLFGSSRCSAKQTSLTECFGDYTDKQITFPKCFLGELRFLEMKHKQIIKKELPVGRETVFTREDVPSRTSNCRSLSHIDLISCCTQVWIACCPQQGTGNERGFRLTEQTPAISHPPPASPRPRNMGVSSRGVIAVARWWPWLEVASRVPGLVGCSVSCVCLSQGGGEELISCSN